MDQSNSVHTWKEQRFTYTSHDSLKLLVYKVRYQVQVVFSSFNEIYFYIYMTQSALVSDMTAFLLLQ